MTYKLPNSDLTPGIAQNISKFLNEPKKILVLEDDAERIAWMREHLAPGHNVAFALNAKEAYALLEADPNWDIFFLDHDLAEEHYEAAEEMSDEERYMAWQRGDTGAATGFDVACYIAAKSELRSIPTIVHSMNPVGSKAIKDALPNAIQIPFGVLQGAFS